MLNHVKGIAGRPRTVTSDVPGQGVAARKSSGFVI